ncbi:hypothetical protein B0H16DRAFT_1888431 [Mycena metata]|uniref:Uncharacterized protein n=1 Tax=Mycena metata TaxID=1033252 RepID=A0AAD7N7Z1_9AGAR|nr:hypothetical protein B0H16DRAFT_1888431 [Mycena metata]
MALALTFMDRKLTDSVVVGPDGGLYYALSTTHGFRGRKIMTITAASGLVGIVNWREDVFILNGVEKKWNQIRARSGGIFSSGIGRPYTLKYHNSHKELLVRTSVFNVVYIPADLTGMKATPDLDSTARTVRFTTYDAHLFRKDDPAVLYFPPQTQDEVERMFLLMVILQTEIDRQDVRILPGFSSTPPASSCTASFWSHAAHWCGLPTICAVFVLPPTAFKLCPAVPTARDAAASYSAFIVCASEVPCTPVSHIASTSLKA